jgi:hypothetical protein
MDRKTEKVSMTLKQWHKGKEEEEREKMNSDNLTYDIKI